MERFFHTLTAETTRGGVFAADGPLRELLQRYFRYDNHERLHSALGYMPPAKFEAAHKKEAAARQLSV